jgi:hypothetical protein
MNNPVYTSEDIEIMCSTWINFNGFSGERCSTCLKTINLLAGGSGWICECGAYNAQHWGMIQLHDNPDMGTPKHIILGGYELHRQNHK